MTDKITSYAQNAEDITLLQAFQGQDTGFYVDIGAAHPIQHSVTKLFYDKGWQGINVEPIRELYKQLLEQRKRDINVRAVIGASEGKQKLYVFPTLPGLTTTDPGIAETHENSGLKSQEITVKKIRLETLLAEHVARPIDFLKIDVEGTEADVLKSFNLAKWRPRVLVIEATEPRTTTPSHQKWEPLVLESGYGLAQFDGLNRFYVHESEPELLKKISRPAKNYATAPISRENSRSLSGRI